MIRFSLTTLFLLVLLAALGCAALLYASPLVEQIAVTAAVLIFGLAVLVAICSRGRARAAAASFAFAGWAYLLLANIGALNLQPHLLTGNVNRWLYATLYPQPGVAAALEESDDTKLTADSNAAEDLLMVTYDLYVANGITSPDGMQLASSGTDGRVRVWNVDRPGVIASPKVRAATFDTIANALWALLLGLLGAAAAAVIFARAHRAAAAPPKNPH